MEKTHKIYLMLVGDKPYVGYTDRDLEQRKKEHIYQAQRNTPEKEMQAIVTGGEPKKDSAIKKALQEGVEITIELIEEAPLHEPLDEAYWINRFKYSGYDLLNTAPGNVWQPYCLVNGELVKTTTDKEAGPTPNGGWRKMLEDKPKKRASKPKEEKAKKPTYEKPTYDEWYKMMVNGPSGNNLDRDYPALYTSFCKKYDVNQALGA